MVTTDLTPAEAVDGFKRYADAWSADAGVGHFMNHVAGHDEAVGVETSDDGDVVKVVAHDGGAGVDDYMTVQEQTFDMDGGEEIAMKTNFYPFMF